MFYYKKNPVYLKINQVAEELGVDQRKMYELVNDLEKYGVIKFKKTPLGSNLIEEEQVKIIEHYIDIKQAVRLPKLATEVLKNTNTVQKKEEDFSWAKNLKYSVWRNY